MSDDQAQKTLEALLQEALQPMADILDKATEQMNNANDFIIKQSGLINKLSDSIVDIAGYTKQALDETDDPEVRNTLSHITQTLAEVIDSMREMRDSL